VSYGLEIKNQDGVIIVDNTYSNLQLDSQVTVAPNASFPIAGTTKGNIVLCRPPINDTGVMGLDVTSSRFYEQSVLLTTYPNIANYICKYVDTFASLGVSGNTGYGLNAYDSAGTLQYGATYRDTSVSLIDAGEMASGNTTRTITLGAYTNYLDECFVMLNNTWIADQSFFGDFRGLYYVYDWVNHNIIIHNERAPSGVNPVAWGQSFTYAVYRIRGL
tara:strand:+ start:3332 stop:3985 length:654 start_codon:yes stop_codon:yes gene_type:complete